MTTNILSILLKKSGVKHTSHYINKLYNEHPNKYNMLGLSQILSEYKIHNAGIRVINKKEDIFNLGTPFIAHIGNEFVTVVSVKEKVSYWWNNTTIEIPIDDFIEIWSGAVLVVEADENSIEPGFKKNKRDSLVSVIRLSLLLLNTLLIVGLLMYQNNLYSNIGFILLLIINLLGIYVGYLLILKQLYLHSNIADRICSLFHKSDCNDVLASPASKLFGIIGWSELGVAYFFSNTLIILATPNLIPYLTLINIFALPYSFWSVWYQKFKIQEWCPLCLVVQFLFWALFASSVIFNLISIPMFILSDVIYVFLIYGTPILIISILLPIIIKGRKEVRVTQAFNSFKMNEKVFKSLLKEQPYHEVNRSVSNILMGNYKAVDIITILSNPHCDPCAKMHIRIEKMIHKAEDKFCFQYILSSFNNELDSSSEFFLYINNKYIAEERNMIYSEWFNGGSNNKDEFFRKFDFIHSGITEEYEKHREWKEREKLHATPTILVNGFEMIDNYKIEDLLNFTNLTID